MKKIIILLAAMTLILSGALCACSNSNVNLDNTTWRLQVAMLSDVDGLESEVIARDKTWQSDEAAPIIDVTLEAKDGTITIKGAQKPFVGAYGKSDVIDLSTIIYSVRVGTLSGNATSSLKKSADGTKTKTLLLNLISGDMQYTMYFVPEA